MSHPKLLDLFCGAGGTGMGFHRAGFDVVGVDLEAHPDYPFPMFVADALTFIDDGWMEAGNFSAVVAGPPCPRYSVATPDHARNNHPDLVEPVRERLIASGLPYVIENVPGAPLIDPTLLCGSMFGLGVRRHRLFESNINLTQPACRHSEQPQVWGVYGQHGDLRGPVPRPNGTSRGGKARDAAHAREVMGIDWMTNWADLADAIPPSFTEFIGRQLITHLEEKARMTDPNPAQRADWYATNHEATHTLDARYGTGHRPAYALVGAMWAPACGCTNPRCFLAEDDSRRLYPTPEEARDAAAKNLHDNEHGPGMEATA